MINEAFPSAGTVTLTIEAYDKLQEKLHTALSENKRLKTLNVFRCKKNSHNDKLALELTDEAVPLIDKAFAPFKEQYELLDFDAKDPIDWSFAKLLPVEPEFIEPANT